MTTDTLTPETPSAPAVAPVAVERCHAAGGKIRHATRFAADRAIRGHRAAARSKGGKRGPVEAWRCPLCGGWHLGNVDPIWSDGGRMRSERLVAARKTRRRLEREGKDGKEE